MKKIVFRDKEFYAEKFIKCGNAIVGITNNKEIGRLQPISDVKEYKIYNEDDTIGTFDEDIYNVNTATTDTIRLIHAMMKEISYLQQEVSNLKEANK